MFFLLFFYLKRTDRLALLLSLSHTHTHTHTHECRTSASVDVPAGCCEPSGPAGVGCRNPELVPAAWSGVVEPGSLLCGLGGIRESRVNPHHLRTEDKTDNNLSVQRQSVTNHGGPVTSSWDGGRLPMSENWQLFLVIYSVCFIYF